MGKQKNADEAGAEAMPTAVRGDDPQLLADIKAFAAELGFGADAGGGGAFEDFAPERAATAIGTTGGAGRKKQRKEAPAKSEPAAGGQAKPAAPKPNRPQPTAAPKAKAAAAAPPLAPLPAVAHPKSILQHEEPGLWWELSASLPQPAPGARPAADAALAEALRQRAEALLANEAAALDTAPGRRGGAGSDMRWLQLAQRSGTTSDKVAAMAVMVQEAPAASLRSLDGLAAMAAKRGGARAVVGSALDALLELWRDVLLPASRKLRFFEAQALSALPAGRAGDRALVYWALEDALKRRYAAFVATLESLSRDNLDFVKDRAVKAAYDLLRSRPEAEGALLSLVVNKLGDPDRKLASKVGYLLTRLLAEHPGMKVVVVREVERFVFRPGLADRARYYAVVYLNQMVLTHRDAAQGGAAAGATLARRLVDLYFTLFQLVLEGRVGTAAALATAKRDKERREAAAFAARRGRKKASGAGAGAGGGAGDGAGAAVGHHAGEMDARMLSALLTGVRRAFPYVAADELEPLVEAHADALFRLIHTGSFGAATQALLLLLQLMTSRNSVSDRFYRALYAVLVHPELPRSSKGPMFLSLLFKALKADVSAKRAAAFAKRLLQVAAGAAPNFACGCLLVVSELLRARPSLWSSVLQGEDKEDDDVERFVDAPDGQEHPAPGGGRPAPGGGAAAAQARGPPAAAPLAAAAGPAAAVAKIDLGGDGSDDDGGSSAAATDSSDEGEEEGEEEGEGGDGGGQRQLAGARVGVERAAAEAGASGRERAAGWPSGKGSYDMRKRDPQYSHAERSCLWELLPLACHAHPSVAAMARTLLAGVHVSYDGDPLRDLTLAAFLDKFVAKKPRAAAKGDSLMQPLRATAATGARAGSAAVGAAFAALAEKDVGPDDAFFHKYYSLQAVQTAAARAAARRRKRSDAKAGGGEGELVSDADDSESDGIDEFLAGEEEGGDEGIGADPDRAAGYDYAGLAAAMHSDSDEGGDGDSGSEGEGGEAGGGGGGEEEELVPGGSDDGGSLQGAEFSDMSGKGGSDASPGSDAAFSSEDNGGGELRRRGEPAVGLDLDRAGSESALGSQDPFSGGGDEGDDDDASSSRDDALDDAEVAALLKRHGAALAGGTKTAGKRGRADADAEPGDDVDPFELAEPTDSEGEGGGGGGVGDSSSSNGDEGGLCDSGSDVDGFAEEEGGGGSGDDEGAGGGPLSVFAAAEDYDTMIARDLAEEEQTPGRKRIRARGVAQHSSSGGTGRGKRRRRQ